jgi:hypothetical protein
VSFDAGSPGSFVFDDDAYYYFAPGSVTVTVGNQSVTLPSSVGRVVNDSAFPTDASIR